MTMNIGQAPSKQIRTISHLLHPPLLDEAGLASALRWYVEGFSERSKINAKLDIPQSFAGVSKEMELSIFRVVLYPDLHTRRAADGYSTRFDRLKPRRGPSLFLRQRPPPLEQTNLSLRRHVFSVDDSASGRHPLRLAGLDHAPFIAIVDGAVEEESQRFESRVRVRLAHRAVADADVEMVIHQHDERIVELELFRRHDLRRQVSRTNKSGPKWRNGHDTSDTTLRFH